MKEKAFVTQWFLRWVYYKRFSTTRQESDSSYSLPP